MRERERCSLHIHIFLAVARKKIPLSILKSGFFDSVAAFVNFLLVEKDNYFLVRTFDSSISLILYNFVFHLFSMSWYFRSRLGVQLDLRKTGCKRLQEK
jgi:hypothetical protein